MKNKTAANKAIIKFVIFFLISTAILHYISSLDIFRKNIGEKILLSDAAIIKKIFNIAGIKSIITTDRINEGFFSIIINSNSVNVVYDCASIFSIFLLVSAMLAFNSKIKDKIIGIPIFSFVLYFINIIRLIVLSCIGGYFPKYLNFAHLYLWQILMIFIVVFLWGVWIEKVVSNKNKIVIFN
ncbi:MAG TPA: hypothetical protein PKY81_15155 [bacterium]|nr:hypothetical protein [bacterium]